MNVKEFSKLRAAVNSFTFTDREVWHQGAYTCTFVKVDGIGHLTIRHGHKTVEYCECPSVDFARKMVEHDYLDKLPEASF